MANLVITSTANTVTIVYNTYSSSFDGVVSGTYSKSEMKVYQLSNKVIFVIKGEHELPLVDAALSMCYIVDTVAGAAPSSVSDLYSKIAALIA